MLTVDWEDGSAKIEATLAVAHMPILQTAIQSQVSQILEGDDNANNGLELLKEIAAQLGVKLKLDASLFEPNAN